MSGATPPVRRKVHVALCTAYGTPLAHVAPVGCHAQRIPVALGALGSPTPTPLCAACLFCATCPRSRGCRIEGALSYVINNLAEISQLAAQTDRLDALLAALVQHMDGAPGGILRCACLVGVGSRRGRHVCTGVHNGGIAQGQCAMACVCTSAHGEGVATAVAGRPSRHNCLAAPHRHLSACLWACPRMNLLTLLTCCFAELLTC